MTGIELGADSCVMARVRPESDGLHISAVHGLQPDEWPRAHVALSDDLRSARRRKGFPKRARVVAWGLHESASASDAATLAALHPLRDAGFVIDDVLSPTDALALLARLRPRAPGRGGAAWLSLNRHGAAIAIVDRGELLYSREFGWTYRPAATPREELLQRYSLIAHLAPELRHGFDVVGAEHGATVDAVITCGDLPDLRSLTMPLIEELDMEVETLDSLDGLKVVAPAPAEQVAEKAPALRLACAAAAGRMPAPERRSMARAVMAAAALVLLAVVAWGTARFAGDDDVPATSARGPEPMVMQQPPVRPPSVEPAPVGPPPATTPGDRPRDPGDVTRPAATMGRQEVPQAQARGIGESRSPTGPSAADRSPRAPLPERERPAARQAERRAPVPLKEPLPVVNSILVAPDRRLAVVDGAIVREGDAVGRRVLVRIEPGAVVLREPSGYEVRVLIRRRVGGAAGSEPGV